MKTTTSISHGINKLPDRKAEMLIKLINIFFNCDVERAPLPANGMPELLLKFHIELSPESIDEVRKKLSVLHAISEQKMTGLPMLIFPDENGRYVNPEQAKLDHYEKIMKAWKKINGDAVIDFLETGEDELDANMRKLMNALNNDYTYDVYMDGKDGFIEMEYHDWKAIYDPIMNEDDNTLLKFFSREEVKQFDPAQVWTLFETNDERWIENRVGWVDALEYIICNNKYKADGFQRAEGIYIDYTSDNNE